jgi:hypothetical protein
MGDGRWAMGDESTAAQAKVLQASFNVYRHRVSNKSITATLSCSIPHAFLGIIKVIVPTTFFDPDLIPISPLAWPRGKSPLPATKP